MEIISVREAPKLACEFVEYFQSKWASEESKAVYEDCIKSSIEAEGFLPQWYLLRDDGETLGCVGIITNDFISRMDIYPWLCALYVEEKYRRRGIGAMLVEKCKEETKKAGFPALYLCTDHVGYYERFGFEYIGDGYHPWGESSRIYKATL